MALETQPTKASVKAFLDSLPIDRREDCRLLARHMRDATSKRAVMWGPSIVGFGRYHYRYASGREGDWFLTGFSPRKQNLTVYIMEGFVGHRDLLERLGPHKVGKSCLYIKRLSDIDQGALVQLIESSIEHLRATYPA